MKTGENMKTIMDCLDELIRNYQTQNREIIDIRLHPKDFYSLNKMIISQTGIDFGIAYLQKYRGFPIYSDASIEEGRYKFTNRNNYPKFEKNGVKT